MNSNTEKVNQNILKKQKSVKERKKALILKNEGKNIIKKTK